MERNVGRDWRGNFGIILVLIYTIQVIALVECLRSNVSAG
jgi:hypothetical protein